MSDSAKRIQASSLRREKNATAADRQERDGVPPTWYDHAERIRAPRWFEQLLHFKGFGGGVPQNTETAAVKPRAGIEQIARRCLFFVEMAWAGAETSPGPLNFFVAAEVTRL